MTVVLNGQRVQNGTDILQAVLQPMEVRNAIDRMRIRINARHAHRNSLNRAAHGLRWINTQQTLILSHHVAQHDWTEDSRMAVALLDAVGEQLDSVQAAGDGLSVEEQRACLQAALSRAASVLLLLEHEVESREGDGAHGKP